MIEQSTLEITSEAVRRLERVMDRVLRRHGAANENGIITGEMVEEAEAVKAPAME